MPQSSQSGGLLVSRAPLAVRLRVGSQDHRPDAETHQQAAQHHRHDDDVRLGAAEAANGLRAQLLARMLDALYALHTFASCTPGASPCSLPALRALTVALFLTAAHPARSLPALLAGGPVVWSEEDLAGSASGTAGAISQGTDCEAAALALASSGVA